MKVLHANINRTAAFVAAAVLSAALGLIAIAARLLAAIMSCRLINTPSVRDTDSSVTGIACS